MKKILGLGIGLAIGGYVSYMIAQGKFHTANGKFLGFIAEDQGSFGLDDVARFGLPLAAAVVGGKIASRFLNVQAGVAAG